MTKKVPETPSKRKRIVKTERVKRGEEYVDGLVEFRKARLAKFEAAGVTLDEMSDRAREVMGRIGELKELMRDVDKELEWFRGMEPSMLDALRSKMLHQFMSDPDRRFTLVDFGIALDKMRLLTGQSTVNLSSLLTVIDKADAMEKKRLGGGVKDGEEGSGE